jgi:hypothetical protein
VLWSTITAPADSPARAAAMTVVHHRVVLQHQVHARCAAHRLGRRRGDRDAELRQRLCLVAERFHAVTRSPRFAAASAKAAPSRPVPRNAMIAMVGFL